MNISVVIPAYNEELSIGACLQSLVDQEEKADEIIVVNNNCTDKTIEIASQFPVRIINETKQGIIPARNKGFESVQTTLIARTDADSRLPTNWIKRIKHDFNSHSIDAVSGPATFYDLSGKQQVSTIPVNLFFSFVKLLTGHPSIFGPNFAIKKTTWEKIKDSLCENSSLVHEDIDIAYHLAPFGKIYYDKKLIVQTSVRRWEKPISYYTYSKMLYNTLTHNHKH